MPPTLPGVREWLRLALLGALPLVMVVTSPQRVTLSVGLAVAYVVGTAAIAWGPLDRRARFILGYTLVAAAFIVLSLVRAETISAGSHAQQVYAAAKAAYFLAVVLPLSASVAMLVRRAADLKPTLVVFIGLGIGLSVLSILLRGREYLGLGRYTWQGNLAALAALLLLQFWLIRHLWLGTALSLLCIGGAAFANSRQSVVALAVGLPALALYWLLAATIQARPRDQVSKRLFMLPLVLALIGALLPGGWLLVFYAQSHGLHVPGHIVDPALCNCVVGRFLNLVHAPGGRDRLIELGWQLFWQHPVVGAGLGSFVDTHAPYPYPHNVLLELAGETGIVGVVLLVGPLLYGWWRILRAGIAAHSRSVASLLALLVVWGVVANLSGDLPSNREIWIFGLVAFGLGMARQVSEPTA